MNALFQGKRIDNGKWVEGYYGQFHNRPNNMSENSHQIFVPMENATIFNSAIGGLWYEVIPETVRRYSMLSDKNDKKIFEGDIVQYNTFNDFDCQSIVKFGEYSQDGSGGEYSGTNCIGFYVEVDNFTCPDWCEDEPECFPYYLKQQNILEVANNCEVIGNIYDNPELITK